MRILVLAEARSEREALATVLGATRHRSELVADAKALLTAHTREPAQVILLVAPSTTVLDLARRIRSVQGAQHPYIVALLDKVAALEITSLFSAGIDDFMRRPLVREELFARIDAPSRIRAFSAALVKSVAYDWSDPVDIRQKRAFVRTAAIVANDLAQIVGEGLAVTQGTPEEVTSQSLRCATIAMSAVVQSLELRISVVAERSALLAAGRAMIGGDLDDSDLRDLLRELVNTAGGALKRAYTEEGMTLTTGLPIDGVVPKQGKDTRWWVVRAAGIGATFGLACELVEKQSERVPASGLREGMVVVCDLRNESGALLVAAGTRLSTTSAARVSGTLGGRYIVEVLSAA